nr:MAG TPA: replication-associated protein [Cressdnaviricota sp.]
MTEEKQESKSKFWMFTINNPLDNDFENIPCEYMNDRGETRE